MKYSRVRVLIDKWWNPAQLSSSGGVARLHHMGIERGATQIEV
jgi:hypothetical protein